MCQTAGKQGNSSRNDEWKKNFEDLQMVFRDEEIKQLKELYMVKMSSVSIYGEVSPEVLATMNSSEGSMDKGT